MHSLLHPLYLYDSDFHELFRYVVYYGIDVQVIKMCFSAQMEGSLAYMGNGFISI